jgi:hypothetical protein
MVVHTTLVIPALGRLRQGITSSRETWVIQQDPVSKNKTAKKI